jgi:thiamine-phosphate pyrophosphorylase
MASARDAAKLARLASALSAGGPLPPLILMTDEIRLPEPAAAARNLPHGSAVILRHRDKASRERLAAELKSIAVARDLLLLISEDAELAIRVGADGLHLPESKAGLALHWKALRPHWLITAAAHSAAAIARAARAGADAALLAPVFATRSHPGRLDIGLIRARLIAGNAPIPVYALGGVNVANAQRLNGSRFSGIAAIEALS